MFWTKFAEKIKTYFIFDNIFSENRAVYEIMSKNVVEPERPHDVKTWRIRVESWISKAACTHANVHAHAPGCTHARAHTHTHKYVIIIVLPRQKHFVNAPQY
jgi:hypothetical protein